MYKRQVLHGVDIGHQARQQVAAAARPQPGGRQALQAPEDGHPYVREHPEDGVVRHQPLRVPEHGPADAEGPRRGDRHHQVQDGRVLRRAGDEPSGRGHQAHGAAQRQAAQQQRQSEPAPAGPRQAPQPRQRRTPGPGYDVRAVRGLRGRKIVACGFVGALPYGLHGRGKLLRLRRRRLHHRTRQPHRTVRHRQQRGPVDDQQHRAAGRQAAYRVDDARLRLAVQVRGRLVEQQDRAVGQERAGQGQALPLPRRQAGTALAEYGLRAVGQRGDEVQGPGVAERGP